VLSEVGRSMLLNNSHFPACLPTNSMVLHTTHADVMPLHFLIVHTYLIGEWLDEEQRTNTINKDTCFKVIGLCLQIL
jgi:hypothetical protein